ncbi:MAG: hemolysin III family protein [Negativibacillus sp.]
MIRYFSKAREPVNSFTHFLGVLLALAEAAFLLTFTFTADFSPITLTSVLVFSISMLLLYGASSWYHYSNAPQKVLDRLRKLDHSMIFVLIAGSYTPICLKYMPGSKGILFSLALWAVALGGSVLKICWMGAPRWLSTAIYLIMGWSILFDWKSLSLLPAGAVALLLCEGISYSIGALCYIFKKPNFSKVIGFHELFHLFILLGTFFHFLTVLIYVVL